MKKRYTDSEQNNKVDFVERDYGISAIRAAAIFIFPLLCVFSIYLFDADNRYVSMAFNCIFTGVTTLAILQRLNHYLKTIHSIEYQNMVFANALNHDTEFCLILKSNGSILYSDSRFNTRFRNYRQDGPMNLFSILKLGNISDRDIVRFREALRNRSSVKAYFSVSKKNSVSNFSLILDPLAYNPQVDVNTETAFSIFLNPLARPQDHFVLKAVKVTKEQVYERLIHRHSLGSYLLNSDGVILSTNTGFLKMFELNTLKRHMFFADLLSKNQTDAKKGEAVFSTSTGTMFKAHITQEVFRDKNNQGYIYGLLSPKTQSFADYQLNPCFAHAPLAIAQCTSDGKIIKRNEAFKRLTGGIKEECIFTYIMHVYSKKIKRYFQSNVINNMSIEAQLCNKTYVKMYLNKFLHNDIVSIICYITDSADRKSLEIQLEQSQKMQAVGQLAGGIAHDFNNILTAIIGFCDLLLVQHPSTDPSFTDIMQIKQNANRATNLIKQLLAFSRKQTLQPKILDVNNIIADLSHMIKRLISENINLNVQYGQNVSPVKADLCQLEQVIINLVVNAKSAMNSGGNLTIRTYNLTVDASCIPSSMFSPDKDQMEYGEYVVVEVADTGHGISKQVMKKIFDPFFSTKSAPYGTGLGLSTVYGIIKQTGGYMYVESTVNVGTRFIIMLPRVYLTEGQHIENKQVQYVENTTEGDSELQLSANILLIEDEDPVREFTSKALKRKGFHVIDINSGKQAIESLSNNDIDIVISDVVMPGMSGPETVSEILKIQPNIKVIFISGYAEEAFHQHKSIDFDKILFLSKPFTLKQLLEKVHQAITCKDSM